MEDGGDLYEVLGVRREASRDEIKGAFRRLAMKYHPDKQSPDSSQAQRDAATLRFKKLSEAVDVLSDHRKRAAYDLRRRPPPASNYNSYTYRSEEGFSRSHHAYGYRHASSTPYRDFWIFALQLLRTRAFLLNSTFACALLGGSYLIDASKETLWKMHNPGKSFEETVESIKKAKAREDRK